MTLVSGRPPFTRWPSPRSCSASPIARAWLISTSCSTQLSSTSVSPYWIHLKLRAATLPSAAKPLGCSRRRATLPNATCVGGADFWPISRALFVTSFVTYSSIMITESATLKKSPLPPTTRTVETPCSSSSDRTLQTKAVIGSLSGATSAFIFSSRIMKLVAQVSSSTRRVVHPTSNASTMLAACDVDPEASPVLNCCVCLPNGKLLMNGEMSALLTDRPSSARIFTAWGSQTTCSRPSPGTLL
mmetsp:Transcript_66117/g.91965  ORF Transcript_66117/g.91965 Transcript_66117/m.91965 type:complete len:244 (+) Transcript_66117:213-944(+)